MAHALPDIPHATASRWADLQLRVISACVLLPIALGGLWAGGTIWTALIGIVVLALGYEWWQLCRRGRWISETATVAAGILYILPAGVALIWLRGDTQQGLHNVLFLLLIVWASDIGAYVVGRLARGPKLAPTISPGKTISGAFGGLLWAALIGCAAVWLGGGRLGHAIAIAVVVSTISQAGDLFESWIKRQVGVKDSGWFIPGHGGLFDRLDGVLTAAPAAGLLALALGDALWR